TPIALAEPSSLFRPSLIVDTVSSATPFCARFFNSHSKVLHFILEPSLHFILEPSGAIKITYFCEFSLRKTKILAVFFDGLTEGC
ncbi:MAG: hypothetical protein ACK5WY_07530, partial [Holosporaceae bacterium]